MPSDPSQRRPHAAPCRAAYSLVEVVAAIGLMAATLVPAMELIRQSMKNSVEDDMRQLLALYAASQVEQQLGMTAMFWTVGSTTGDYAADGHPGIRYVTTCSDDPVDGGIVGQLMDVRTTVYDDANNDDVLTAGEKQCSFRTKIGKFATYEAMAP